MITFEIVLPNEKSAELIREWRNDPEVLHNSVSYHKPKSFEQFFPEFLKVYSHAYFIQNDGERAGLISFDEAEGSPFIRTVEVSILVTKPFQGKGMASQALLEIEAYLVKMGIEKVIARVKPHNLASLKTFQKAGYQKVAENELFLFEKILKTPLFKEPFIIAEAGSNWRVGTPQENLTQALKLIDAAKEAGADAVKFQTFKADSTYVENAGASNYLSNVGIKEDIHQLFKKIELSDELIFQLANHCSKNQIEFMSSIFSVEDFERIDPFVKKHKIASFEIGFAKLIQKVAESRKTLILSTGAATIGDVDWAFDYYKKSGGEALVLLQCTSHYPTELQDLHLKVIPEFKRRYGVTVGLSDHSLSVVEAPLTAIALGGMVIEKHFSLDPSLPGPDHAFALNPEELKQMVGAIRSYQEMVGLSLKKIFPVEEELYFFAKRGIQALRDIRPGEILVEGENIAVLRPGQRRLGLHPKFLSKIVGKFIVKSVMKGEGVQWEDIEGEDTSFVD